MKNTTRIKNRGASGSKVKRSGQTYNTDGMVRKIHRALVDDLRPIDKSWFSDPRKYTGPGYKYWTPYAFKVMYQLEHFCKRVLLDTDTKFDSIKLVSLDEFVKSQTEFGVKRRTRRLEIVMERARKIVHSVLGEFDYETFFGLCSFGKKAAKGLPQRESYLDTRIENLNGSSEQIEWFKACMAQDVHLHRACRRGLKKAYKAYVIDIHAVPKSWKAARIIAPDTTIGGFLSRGLGAYVREQLETGTHIRLSTQQDRHKILARQASRDGVRCTLDMKRASDSFVEEHILWLTPESWHPVLKVVRTPTGLIKSSDGGEQYVELKSYMLMGSGHTFPLQTLLFYAICKATVELLGSRTEVDVYGDDIIMSSRLSSYVIDIFDDAGFTVNVEKSFVDGPFRESCGGDYHSGVDVRPFMPEHVCCKMGKHQYTEFLHKMYNGLITRWDPVEIPETLDLILLEILKVQGNLCPIPEEFPETQGLKYIPRKYAELARKPTCEGGITRYLVLSSKVRRRKPKTERIYYWYWLREAGVCQKPDLYGDGSPGRLDEDGREPVKGSHELCWKVVPKIE